MSHRRVSLMQQSVWDIDTAGRESMPLACGFLKATLDADERVRAETDVAIHNYAVSATPLAMLKDLVAARSDVVGFSVFGWNLTNFGNVAEAYRQLRPDAWLVMGGTHVTDQAERVFRLFPSVDVIVNGEGELTFRELTQAFLGGASKNELSHINGISFRGPGGRVVTTEKRARIMNLDEIPSPFLSGALEMENARGEFKYDVALVETNRGCPYKCAFCYWGGAIGQKIRSFSLDRLQAEVDLFSRYQVGNVVLCDANFGMTEQDEAYMEMLIRAREKHGYPRGVITSWAKNKGKTFYRIVRRMKQAGFHSSFTLALQTLSEPALKLMGRKNMKVNEWQDLAEWLRREGLELYGELIWGCPGETYDSFLKGYDDLAGTCARIATYPHLILPNTEYSERRQEFGFVTWRTGGKDDFERVLAHNDMSFEDNRKMHRFLFWARTISEYMLLRYTWGPLRILENITQSQVLLSLDRWIDGRSEPAAAMMRAHRAEVVENLDAYRIEKAVQAYYSDPELGSLLQAWWEEEMVSRVAPERAAFFRELFRYDWLTRPICRGTAGRRCERTLDDSLVHRFDGEDYYVMPDLAFDLDIPDLVAKVVRGEVPDFTPAPLKRTLYFKRGFHDYIFNHEFYGLFVGKTPSQLGASGLWKATSEWDLPGLPRTA